MKEIVDEIPIIIDVSANAFNQDTVKATVWFLMPYTAVFVTMKPLCQ